MGWPNLWLRSNVPFTLHGHACHTKSADTTMLTIEN